MDVLLISALVIICCVLFNQVVSRVGAPMLLAFIFLGMLFGVDGIFKIEFENFRFAEKICSAALIFIMFYGGFGTNWNEAKPVAAKAIILSTAGVFLTAAFTTLFCCFVLHMDFRHSFLLGSVISSTDAASVFSILRSNKMGLKHRTASLLEVESGSNDPCSYMLTVIALSLLGEGTGAGHIAMMIFLQIGVGIIIGFAMAFISKWMINRIDFYTAGFEQSFIIGIALLSYALAQALHGNGYLSVYITGIILGNIKLKDKKSIVHFFDGITSLTQMLIFFLLGLLSTPSKIPQVLSLAVPVVVFLTFVSRPLATFILLAPFKSKINQQALVSFAGLRGASSIVFAIMAVNANSEIGLDLFHIVFCLVLISIIFQGSLLSPFAKLVKMNDENADVLKTFSDYTEEINLQFITIDIKENHAWCNKSIKEINLIPDTLIVMILRNHAHLVPHGDTVFRSGDIAVLSAKSFHDDKFISLTEQVVDEGSDFIGKQIWQLKLNSGDLIVTIIRGTESIIPKGNTVIEQGDILVINRGKI